MEGDVLIIAEQIGRLSVTGLLALGNYVQWKHNESLREENKILQESAIERSETFTAKAVELITEVRMMFHAIQKKT